MRHILIFIIVVFIFSCANDVKIDATNQKETQKNINLTKDEAFTVKLKKQKLHIEAQKAVENWPEYIAVSEFIPVFYKTTTQEALFNSIELYKLTSSLKDSTKNEKFKTPSVKTRINVLNNEALRLFDMDSIPSITNKEVIKETENIINAYNALNIKINNHVKRALLSKDLLEFDNLFRKDSSNIEKEKKLKKRTRIKTKKRNQRRINPLNINKKIKERR